MKVTKKVLSLVMALVMVFSLIPFAAVGAEAANVVRQQSVPLDTSSFYTIFHLDCGRNYFSVQQIKNIIDEMAKDGFNTLELAIGNDGLRFLLDDMSVGSYSSVDVKSGIQAGNRAYRDNGTNELTQTEMDAILAYAKSKNIAVIPLINTPGHMDAIIAVMKELGISNPAYKDSNGNSSTTTLDVTNEAAVNFTLALVNKYIQYFAAQGCKIFNMGCDEFATDLFKDENGMGFGHLISAGHYDEYAAFVNSMAAQVQNAGMTPMAFNDGFYYPGSSESFDENIAIAYWSAGYGSYRPASAKDLAAKGHKIINTNDAWYYVVGRSSGTYGLSGARSGAQNTLVTDVPGDNDPGVVGAMQCVWCDEKNAVYNESEVLGLMSTLAENNSEYFTAAAPSETSDVPAADDPEAKVAGEETINLTVGESKSVEVGDNVSVGSYDTTDTSVATAKVENVQTPGGTTRELGNRISLGNGSYTGVIKSGDYYLVRSGTSLSSTTDINEATVFTIIKSDYNNYYTISSDNYYLYYDTWYETLSFSNNNYSNWTYSSSQYGFYTSRTDLVCANGTWKLDNNNSNKTHPYAFTETSSDPINQNYATFTGLAVGTADVTIGDVLYHIVATDAPPSNAMTASTLTLEYWITNEHVYTRSGGSGSTTRTIQASAAQSTEGVAIKEDQYAPETGYWGTTTVYYWQSMRLDEAHKQEKKADMDRTSDGTTFTHVRYHDGAWQYKTVDGVWHYFLSTDQAVAYYLQKTEVTKEVDTYMKDYGYHVGGNQDNTESYALCVGVVYPDGTLSPDEDGIYQNAIIYNQPANSTERNIGIIAPEINGDYTIEKITYTFGTKNDIESDKNWHSNESINWNKITTAGGSTWYDETVVWQESDGTTPVVNGKTSNIKWTAPDTAYLILIYLKPVHHEDNLTVIWHDDSGNADILTQEVVVNEGVTFLNGLHQNSAVHAGSFTLDDDAYITNTSSVKQTFNKVLTVMPGIAGKYASGLYKYQSADISEDGKTLTLHYVLPDTTVYDPNYVVDFGLPMTFPLSDFVSNVNQVKSVAVTSNATYNAQNQTITFKPTGVLRGVEPISVYITFNDSTNPVQKNIGILPATTVYYEEGFASFGEGWVGGSTGSAEQTSERIVDKTESHKVNNYGYDPAYASNATASNGTEATTSVKGASATFDFHGTGVDIYANCDSASGIFNVFVTDDDGKIVKFAMVNTIASGAYGDKVVSGADNTKIVSIQGLDYGTYNVKLVNAVAGKTIHFDGFRVYGTIADDDNAYYIADLEDSPKFIQMRNAVLTVANVSVSDIPEGGGDQVFDQIDGPVEALVLNDTTLSNPVDNANTLLNEGPKNELYLAPNQSLVFTVKTDHVVQLGMKAPAGPTSYQIDDGTETALNSSVELNSSVDMFYTIANAKTATDGKTITIKNKGSNVLAITELKVCDDPSFALSTLTEEDIAAALDTIFAPAQPEVTYADAKLTVIVNSVSCELMANGVVGESHTFTADEIRAAAESLVAEGFSLDEADFSDVEVAFGEQSSVEFSASENQTEQPPEVNPFQQMIDLLIKLFRNLFGRH